MSTTLFLIEIQSWDWPLHVGVMPRSAAVEPDLEGSLLYVKSVKIEGLLLAPEEHRSKRIHLTVYPLPRETIFGDREQRNVGSLGKAPPARPDLSFSANLFLPADALQAAIFCLGSVWRRVHVWVDEGADPGRGAVTDFAFSADAQL